MNAPTKIIPSLTHIAGSSFAALRTADIRMSAISGGRSMNHKRKKPRTKSRSTGAFPNGTPSHWNILFHSRPRRRRTAMTAVRLLHGADPDVLIWDLGNHKPHKYYW
jgi:hypothetical protein